MKTALLVCALLAVAPVRGEECFAVEDERILGRDLAGARPEFSALDPGQFIAYTPQPGARRILLPSDLRRLKRRHDLPEGPSAAVCFERASEPLTEQRLLSALRAALPVPDAKIELADFDRRRLPRGELDFRSSGLHLSPGNQRDGSVVWRGALRYGEKRSMPVWARVRISVRRRQVLADRELPAGLPVTAESLRVEEFEGLPSSGSPLDSVDGAIGKLPRRTIRPGEALCATLLRAAPAVKRGDTVAVEVLSGGASLSFEARAESAGSIGDQVVVRNPSNGQRFAALVEGAGRVSVRPQGRKERP